MNRHETGAARDGRLPRVVDGRFRVVEQDDDGLRADVLGPRDANGGVRGGIRRVDRPREVHRGREELVIAAPTMRASVGDEHDLRYVLRLLLCLVVEDVAPASRYLR